MNGSGRGVSSFQEGAPPRAADRCDQVGLGTRESEDASCDLVQAERRPALAGSGIRPADLAVTCPEGTPTYAAGRLMVIGLGTKAAKDAVPVLCLLSYVAGDGGTRTRNLRIKKEPPLAQQADRDVKVRDNRRDIGGCEATVRTRTSWFRARRGTSSTTSHCVWTGGLEPPTPGSRSRCAPVAPRPGGTDGRIRTDTDGGLSAVPLPVGLRQRDVRGPRERRASPSWATSA